MQQFEEWDVLDVLPEGVEVVDSKTRNALKSIEKGINEVVEGVEEYLQSVVSSCDPMQEGYKDL